MKELYKPIHSHLRLEYNFGYIDLGNNGKVKNEIHLLDAR